MTYGSQPQNPSLTTAQVDERVREILNSASATGSYAPLSVPWSAVNLPMVTEFPKSPSDRDEVNLLNETTYGVSRWIYVKKTESWTQIGGSPIGVIEWTGAATAPTGYVIADGSAISRTTYAGLFALYGTTHGVGDGSTTFNVPSMVNRMPIGAGGTYALGATGGAATHTLTSAEMPAHTHTPLSGAGGDRFVDALGGVSANITTGGGGYTLSATTASTGGGGAHNNLPPYIALTPIIRT
jgi:microcystin-dependent protein